MAVKTNIVIDQTQFSATLTVENRSKVASSGDTRVIVYAPEGAEFANLPSNCTQSNQTARCTLEAVGVGASVSLNLQLKSTELGVNRWFASVHEIANEGMGDDPLLANNVVELRTFASLDEDGDGLPDYYEWRNNLIVGQNDRNADPDQDGVSNIDEYKAGTDPTDLLIVTSGAPTPEQEPEPEPEPVADRAGDQVADVDDAFPDNAAEWADSDGDEVGDNADNCRITPNVGQEDLDGDGKGDVCDLDIDGDGYDNEVDLQPLNPDIGIFSLDIDGDKSATALSDGLLIIRHLFKFSGTSLTEGALNSNSTLTDPDVITANLNAAGKALDVDDNGTVGALSDGLLIIRRLFKFEGESLVAGALGDGAQRTNPEEIAAYIDALIPPSQ